jgi:phosphatidylserine/phosphatidylglycerophosphate/cardiolipin synthase-like enzyme
VHSKLMICDDEVVLIGSANICQRSMTCDSELQVAIVDEEGRFAREFRKDLWAEHLNLPPGHQPDLLDDPIRAYETFKAALGSGPWRGAKLYGTGDPGDRPLGHETAITSIIEPYYGPDGLR